MDKLLAYFEDKFFKVPFTIKYPMYTQITYTAQLLHNNNIYTLLTNG